MKKQSLRLRLKLFWRFAIKHRLSVWWQKPRLIWKTGLFTYLEGLDDFRVVWDDISKNKRRIERIHGRVKRGRLEAFNEQGTEGYVWSVYEDGKSGYEALHCLRAGDQLVIFKHDGSFAFNGVIDPDREAGRRPHPQNPDYVYPVAFDCGIHWTQRGWTPENWAALFLHGVMVTEDHELLRRDADRIPYRAILIKAEVDE